jgi:Replication-relaxation
MRGDAELAEWWSARRCAAAWGEVVRPDGYAVWVEGGWRQPFLFELDLASERLAQLEAGDYAVLARAAGHPTWVLFCFPTRGRETAARRVLVHRLSPWPLLWCRPDSRRTVRCG